MTLPLSPSQQAFTRNSSPENTGPIMRSNAVFENAAARQALAESRAEESIRTARLFSLGSKIRFHARRGMSKASLERIYGRDIVADVLGSMRAEQADSVETSEA